MANVESPDWKPRMLPPYWFVLGVAVALVLAHWLPVTHVLQGRMRMLGIVPIVGGGLFALWGERQFARAGTGVVPGSEITAFVNTGPFRFTRNPMYLGMTFALLGVAMLTGAASAFVVAPCFLLLLDRRFVHHEEKLLRRHFGDEAWNAYAASARRWL